MQANHSWKGWYFVGGVRTLVDALHDARQQAKEDHPSTPTEAMMTPTIRRVPQGTHVFVIGRDA